MVITNVITLIANHQERSANALAHLFRILGAGIVNWSNNDQVSPPVNDIALAQTFLPAV